MREVYLRQRLHYIRLLSRGCTAYVTVPYSAPVTSHWSFTNPSEQFEKRADRLVCRQFSFFTKTWADGGNLTTVLMCKSTKQRDCYSNPLAWGLWIIWSREWTLLTGNDPFNERYLLFKLLLSVWPACFLRPPSLFELLILLSLCVYSRYSVEGFLDKNKDPLFQDFKRLMYNRCQMLFKLWCSWQFSN